MRADAMGFFWFDEPPKKREKKEKEKRTPPEPVWLEDDYLPGIDEARAFNLPILTDDELIAEVAAGNPFVVDCEVYPNYFLAAFKSVVTGKLVLFECGETFHLHSDKLRWLLATGYTVGFNSNSYDLTVLAVALETEDTEVVKQASDALIIYNERPKEVLRSLSVPPIKKPNHVDLIEVAPLRASLKIYGGRLHTKRMQDLPFPPDKVLSPDQILITRWYCGNDLAQTQELLANLTPMLRLRERLSAEYGTDLRSRSDAQIAETVISKEVTKLNGYRAKPPFIPPGTVYYYRCPPFLKFQSPLMQWAMGIVTSARFIVSGAGNIGMPDELKELKLEIGGSVYRMGIGGLHSSEKRAAHVANEGVRIIDRDVASYYPAIILNLALYPDHLGRNFLRVYSSIVKRRLEAKRAGDKVTSDSLKITINGAYGKLGSMFSSLYSPDLLIQVTLTGQLSLLMLIERLELAGVPVISANTDGIVTKCKEEQKGLADSIVAQWEADTKFETEETEYAALYSRDVNNYLAVKKDGSVKAKGAFGDPGLTKNPTNTVCNDAVQAYLRDGTPVEETIRACTDLTRFINVRTVKGGGVKNGEYLGKSIRWYYAEGEEGEIVYAKSGNRVPRSEGAKPVMELPGEFPSDVDYGWYVAEAESILEQIGVK